MKVVIVDLKLTRFLTCRVLSHENSKELFNGNLPDAIAYIDYHKYELIDSYDLLKKIVSKFKVVDKNVMVLDKETKAMLRRANG